MDNIMHEAFNILRNEGLSNIQYMKDVPSLDAQGGKGAPNSYIVVDTLNKDRRTISNKGNNITSSLYTMFL